MTRPGSNTVAIAGAGTGKTTWLARRALVALASGRVPVESLAAITFTERAAADLRERLTGALEILLRRVCGGGDQDTSSGRVARLALEDLEALAAGEGKDLSLPAVAVACRSSLDRIEDAFIGTIHGFCADLLRRHPIEARVDPFFRVDDGLAWRRFHEERWPLFLAREFADASAPDGPWERILPRAGLRELGRIARALCSFEIPLDNRIGNPPDERRNGVRVLVPVAREFIERLVDLGQAKLKDNCEELSAVLRTCLGTLVEEGLDALRASDASRDEILFKDAALKLGKKYAGTIPLEDAEKLLKQARTFVREAARIDPGLLDDTIAVLLPWARRMQEEARQAGLLGFAALLSIARDLLLDTPDVREVEKQRWRLLLVDEFQDTDPIQYDIVFLLSEQPGVSGDDPFATPLEPGKLFVVGDPKQSIYRFRNADIAACQRAISRIEAEGGERIVLGTNYRSRPEILDPLNRLFDPLFDRIGTDIQPRYEPIQADRKPFGDRCVCVLTIPSASPDASVDDQRRREANVLASEIVSLTSDGSRSCRDIAVLFRAMTSVRPYARALREAGIPFVVEGGKTFREKVEVRLAMSLLRAIASPSDPVAFLAVARSPLGACSDRELAGFVASGGRLPARRPVDTARFPGIERTRALLSRLLGESRGLPVDEVVRLAWEVTPLAAMLAIGYEGAQRVANVRSLLGRAARLAREFGYSLDECLRTLAAEFDEKDCGETPLSDEHLDAVRIFTVHAAKGLEFPIVFLADLLRQPNNDTRMKSTVRWRARDGGGAAISLLAEGETVPSAHRVLEKLENRREEDAESVRQFYVACTRARERLVLLQSGVKPTGEWSNLLKPWGYTVGQVTRETVLDGKDVENRFAAEVESVRSRPGGEEMDLAPAVAAFESAARRAAAANTPWTSSPTQEPGAAERRHFDLDEEEPGAEEPIEGDGDGGGRAGAERGVAAAAGTVFHALMERWDLKDPTWLREATGAIARREAAGRFLPAGPVEREVAKVLDAFLGSVLPARLRALDIIGREVPVLHPRDGVLMQGVADLLYREPGGGVVVADHKTDLVPPSAVPALAVHYAPQLRAYVSALRAALPAGTPVRAELWLARTGRIVPVGT